MKINIIFFLKNKVIKDSTNILKIKHNHSCDILQYNPLLQIKFFKKSQFGIKTKFLKKHFLKKSILFFKNSKFLKTRKKLNLFFFLNKFFINFLEMYFKSKIIINIKKGTNKLLLKQISFRKFTIKYFKKHLRVGKQIIGILYYTFLLKDATIFVNFFKRIIERLNLKLHKKVFLGLRKLIKDLFKPLFNFLGLSGVFFNIKGKIGVSGSSKKRRYFFHFGKHSITNRTLKVDIKSLPLWTPTGTLGFSFLVFF